MRPIVIDGEGWSVSLSVGLSVAILSPAKIAEPIEMLLRLWTWVGPRNHVTDGGPDPPMQRDNFEGERYLHGRWLSRRAAERARMTIIYIQRSLSFGETSDQVHFSCRKLC